MTPWELTQQHYVEEVALYFERDGLPRMAGRILGWLLICDPPHQSSADLARILHASKGSISTMAGLLLRTGLIERIGLPGNRRDYYRMRPDAISTLFREGVARVTALRVLTERGLSMLADRSPQAESRLKALRDFTAFFEEEYPALLDRWEARPGPEHPEV